VYVAVINLNLGRLQYRAQAEDANATMARLTGLNPNTTYRIYLAAETVAGIGDHIFFDSTTSLSGRTFVDDVQEFHCLSNSQFSIRRLFVFW